MVVSFVGLVPFWLLAWFVWVCFCLLVVLVLLLIGVSVGDTYLLTFLVRLFGL